ncbi:hypothetical protein HU200_033527 [Digitaria exilis]|uniref:Uncharacterized protein n=1 Tax=Digitaria exilis TaxID=1010633 RepID=A0A835BRK2_9POAL|nr:hypothetical protein HU200_033527 [Digitaria exilis]
MRTSPRWNCTHHGLPQVVLRLRLRCHVQLEFSLHLWTVLAISPTYDVETRRIRMRWKGDDDAVVLVLVLAPEDSWIILCNNERCCITCFGPTGPYIVSGFGPS